MYCAHDCCAPPTQKYGSSFSVCLQVLVALREELAVAHRAHSEAAHKLRAQRQKAVPWR
jgi:hypothetical protein